MLGLFGGDFAGYRIPTDVEVNTALGSAVVAIDANVLLNLYRYRPQTSRDLLTILERLGDRLVVPHQALREFWRHRQRSAGSPVAATSAAQDAIDRGLTTVIRGLETWAKQVGLDGQELDDLRHRAEASMAELKQTLATSHEDSGGQQLGGDTILLELERILHGRVTEPLTQDESERCLAEARRRMEAGEPPGFRDAAKETQESADGGAGDYLVWYQSTRHAAAADADLVIVTADEKDDWWWRQRSSFIGPRPELSLEFQQLCGKRLFLLRPADLITRASAFDVQVHAGSAADASRASVADQLGSVPWTFEAYQQLLDDLGERYSNQRRVVLEASNSGGFLPRRRVLEVIGRAPDANLVRFALPGQLAADALVDAGVLTAGAQYPLEAMYDGPGKTIGYRVPEEFVEFEQRRVADSAP